MQQPDMPEWRLGPSRVDPSPTPVDIWRVRGVPAGGTPPPSPRTLAAQALRDILVRYLPDASAQPEIVRDIGGKPRLAGMPGLHFNLSHCRDLALVAVSRRHEVGVDVEGWRDIADPLRLARRVFAAADLDRLEQVAGKQRNAMFFDLWTQMEARQKAFGLGIFAPAVATGRVAWWRFRPTAKHFACVCWHPPDGDATLRFFDFVPLA